MNGERRFIEWVHLHETPKKSSDWFWVLGIIAIAGIIAAIFLDNMLFALVIALGAIALSIAARKHGVREMLCQVSERGIMVGDTEYPYHSIESFCVDRSWPENPVLRFKSQHVFTPLVSVHVPEEHADPIESILIMYLTEEPLEEPMADRISAMLGL